MDFHRDFSPPCEKLSSLCTETSGLNYNPLSGNYKCVGGSRVQALVGVRGNGLCRDFACHAKRPLVFFNDFNRPSEVVSHVARRESRAVSVGGFGK